MLLFHKIYEMFQDAANTPNIKNLNIHRFLLSENTINYRLIKI